MRVAAVNEKRLREFEREQEGVHERALREKRKRNDVILS